MNYIAEELRTKFAGREDRVGQGNGCTSIVVSGSDDVLKRLQKHLSGELRLGLYNLLPDGTVRWAVVEFENHKDAESEDRWLADALNYQQKLEALSIPSMLERSKNPNGQCYHLHIAFDQPLPARTVREGLRGIGKQLFESFDNEVFPKSDNGLGNFIWLPLFGGSDEWGHGITEERTVFLDASGQVEPDQEAALKKWQFADGANCLTVTKRFVTATAISTQPTRNGTGIELNQPGLDKMEANCPIIAQWVKDPTGWQYDHWLGLGSNYVVFKDGWDRFVELSRQDAANFDQAEIERIRDEVLNFHGPQTYEKFRAQGLKFELTSAAPKAPAGWGSISIGDNDAFVRLKWDQDYLVKEDTEWEAADLLALKTLLRESTGKLTVVCPVCGHQDAVTKLDEFGFVHIWCGKCNKVYFEHPVTPGMFAFKGELHRIETRANKYISPELLKKEHFRNQEDFEYAKRAVFNNPKLSFSSDDFQLRRIGSAESEKIGYAFAPAENAIILHYPAIPAKVQDNALINHFLEELFGEHAEFIKNWLAVYTYTNYQQLPVIVLAGSRSAGKNTFADMVGKIYPKLLGLWDGDVKPFNPQYTNKLLFVDENRNSHKPEQYAELKRITGSDKLPINKKYESEFNAPNNLNLIFATNDPKPIALKWGEGPDSEKVNNFFIHYCKKVPRDNIDMEIKFKLEDRLGHYVRTELKERFEHLSKNRDPRNRYFLAAPITPLADDLYASSMTSVEMEAEELAEILVMGKHETVTNSSGHQIKELWYDPTEYRGEFYVKLQDIRAAISFLGLRSASTTKAYTEALVRMGVISMRGDFRNNKRQLGFKILRPKSHYADQSPDDPSMSEESDKLDS
ncbi:MAG: hypothetical protein IPK53_11700 [bacterium]|nr:hypothetical protein [bacterium]